MLAVDPSSSSTLGKRNCCFAFDLPVARCLTHISILATRKEEPQYSSIYTLLSSGTSDFQELHLKCVLHSVQKKFVGMKVQQPKNCRKILGIIYTICLKSTHDIEVVLSWPFSHFSCGVTTRICFKLCL